jgi:hypothetical protein
MMDMATGKVAWSVRGYFIYVLALPLLPAMMYLLNGGSPSRLAAIVVSLGLLVTAVVCVRLGVRRQRRRALSRYTRSDTHNLTWIGCTAVAVACFVLQYVVINNSLAYAAVIGALGFAGAFLSYGSMWARAKPKSAHGYSSDEVVAALRSAEAQVQGIEAVYVQLPRGDIRRKLKSLAGKTHRLMHAIEEDPRELRRARKYLNVFLPGVQQVAQTYRKALDQSPDPEFDQRFRNLLDKTAAALNRHEMQRASKVAFDLDVQMAVLRTQLDEEIRR